MINSLGLYLFFLIPETMLSTTTQGVFTTTIELFVCFVLSVQCSDFYQKFTIDQIFFQLYRFINFRKLKCSIKL